MYVSVGRFLDSVPAVAVGYFREAARELIEKRGAEEALAAALAHISGATSLEQRSLISSDAVRQQPLHSTHLGLYERCFSQFAFFWTPF